MRGPASFGHRCRDRMSLLRRTHFGRRKRHHPHSMRSGDALGERGHHQVAVHDSCQGAQERRILGGNARAGSASPRRVTLSLQSRDPGFIPWNSGVRSRGGPWCPQRGPANVRSCTAKCRWIRLMMKRSRSILQGLPSAPRRGGRWPVIRCILASSGIENGRSRAALLYAPRIAAGILCDQSIKDYHCGGLLFSSP